jgi:AraC-type transcriptional regulator N-terminus
MGAACGGAPLGDEVYRYGVGNYLVVSLDLPVVSRVTEASSEKPHLGLGMAIDPERLKEVMNRVPPARVTVPPDEMRGVVVNEASSDLLEARPSSAANTAGCMDYPPCGMFQVCGGAGSLQSADAYDLGTDVS